MSSNEPPLWMAPIVAIGFPLVFALWWSTVVWIISRVSGWSALAAAYGTDRPLPDDHVSFASGRMRWGARYNNSLHLAATAEGLFIDVFTLFRPGHRRLFIPWEELRATDERVMFVMPALRLQNQRVPGVPLVLWSAEALSLVRARLPAA